MLRILILALILANGAYFAWSQGMLRDYGFAPADPGEPLRMAQQVQPQALRVLSAADLQRIEDLARSELASRECLLAGPFDEAQANALRRGLETTLPAEAWRFEDTLVPARWIIYMGKYPNADALAKKRTELSTMQLSMEALTNPALEIGLSLGSFSSEAAAAQELARLSARGVRTARVVLEQPEAGALQLRLPSLSRAQKERLNEIRPLLLGKPLAACALQRDH